MTTEAEHSPELATCLDSRQVANAIRGISAGFVRRLTKQGHKYWSEVFANLLELKRHANDELQQEQS